MIACKIKIATLATLALSRARLILECGKGKRNKHAHFVISSHAQLLMIIKENKMHPM